MVKTKKPQQRLPGAEASCLNAEQEEIVNWLRKVKFRRAIVGGVDEVQMWKKLEELYALYDHAIRAERIRYDALLAAYKSEHPPNGEPRAGPEGETDPSSQPAADSPPEGAEALPLSQPSADSSPTGEPPLRRGSGASSRPAGRASPLGEVAPRSGDGEVTPKEGC